MTESTHRLFVAVIPPPHVLEHLDELIAPMRAARPDLSWVASRNLHVTVTFMPHVQPSVSEQLPDVLARAAADLTPARVSFAGAGHFDEHVLWAGLAGEVEGLEAIAAGISSAAAAAGAGPESRRPFRPHLSLARGAGRLDAHLGPLADQLDGYAGPVWQIDELSLVRSHLGRAAHHETLAVLPLGG
jgi:2'-5' RNA ligase